MKRLLLVSVAILPLLIIQPAIVRAQAQQQLYWQNLTGAWVPGGTANPLPVTGSFSATIAGFTPSGSSAQTAVSNTSTAVALSSDADVLFLNTGTVTEYVALGTSNAVTATTSNIAVPGGSWIELAVGTNTYAGLITASGTTTNNAVGGSGIATGSGGGSSGGGVASTVTLAAGTANIGSVVATGTVSVAGTVPVTVSGTANVNIGNNGTVTTTGTTTVTGTIAGSGTFTVNGTTVNNGGSVAALLGTTNGWTPKILNALGTTVTNVKTSAAEAGMLQCYNPNSSQIYVQMFNTIAASVTLGTTAPTLSVPVAATSTGGWALSNPGINFGTALSVAATTTATGSTVPSTTPDCNIVYN